MDEGSRLIPVVILNWNGEDDTVECLRSIRASDQAGFVPVVVDNGSRPEAVERLKRECSLIYGRIRLLRESEVLTGSGARGADSAEELTEDSLVFIQNEENRGFAKGCNVGIRFAELVGAEWVMLLNNDTAVEAGTFRELRRFLGSHPSFTAVTAQIRYFEPSTRIQNCGGYLTYFGSREYLFADRDVSSLPRSPFSIVTFVTGCALLFRHAATGALTEEFFFGEEDYEFSLRMKARSQAMACVHGAVVHHKARASIGRSSRLYGSILVQYVNRLVNTRNHYSKPRWHATRMLAYLYLPVLLRRNGMDPRGSVAMIRSIEAYLRDHRGVDRVAFQAMVMSDIPHGSRAGERPRSSLRSLYRKVFRRES